MSRDRQIDEFKGSLLQPIATDGIYRRVVATAEQAHEYYQRHQPSPELEQARVEVDYGPLRVVVSLAVLEKMRGWVSERSCGFSLEVQGRFLAKRRPDHLLVDDFIPLPSFCQSLSYESADPHERRRRFGQARMRTIAIDDWKPMETQFYRELGIFSERYELPIDPFKVPVPFHSHYLKSVYQHGPSPGDYDHLYHLKWLYAPGSGKNVLYSGVVPHHIELPHRFEPELASAHADTPAPTNADDCRVVFIAGLRAGETFTIPEDANGLTIGRAVDCDIVLDAPDIVAHHLTIRWGELGQLVLEPQTEALVWRDGEPLVGRGLLVRPCELAIGPVRFRVTF